jgi:hypothetical protein
MKLEKQVCSLELAKELKKLGVKQESSFYWEEDMDFLVKGSGLGIKKNGKYIVVNGDFNLYGGKRYSAFTTTELGDILPEKLYNWNDYNNILELKQKKHDGIWEVIYNNAELDNGIYISEKTESDARAKMLIHLIKNDIIKV